MGKVYYYEIILLTQYTGQANYYIRLDSSVAEIETDYAWLLDAVRRETNCEVGVLYGVHEELSDVSAIAVRSRIAPRTEDIGVRLDNAAHEWIKALTGPLQGRPAGESNFKVFPEVLQYDLKRLVIAPLRAEKQMFGLLTLGRSVEAGFDPPAIEMVQRTARLLTAVLERDFLQRGLLERKLVDRAKGILQQRRRLSEEQAYQQLRDDSHSRGIPMIDVAKEIIDIHVQQGGRFEAEAWRETR
jgi:GAF domain-containing protein